MADPSLEPHPTSFTRPPVPDSADPDARESAQGTKCRWNGETIVHGWPRIKLARKSCNHATPLTTVASPPTTNPPPPTTTTDACRVMFLSNQSQIPKCASSPLFTLITFPSLKSPVRHATHLPEPADTSIEPRLAPEQLLPPSMTRDASPTPNESSL